ncbi:MAG: DUF4838 domain-containing protein [Verrucomicrobiales bacterium]|nr:DUF4838 domain-containing protein [Verrucomicrobiales bacterium]
MRLLLFIAGCILSMVSFASANELKLIYEGKSDYVIVISTQSKSPKKLNEAATLLQSSLARATGVTLPIVEESEPDETRSAIYLGNTTAAMQAGLPVDEVKGWGFLNQVVGRNIYLVGEEAPSEELTPHKQAYSGFSGTYKAVTTFLENVVGVRFVLPGEWGIHVPLRKSVLVDETLHHRWSPSFVFGGRRVSPYSGKHEYDPYAIANNYLGRYSTDSKEFWSGGSHTWNHFVPREKYIKSHPEYFALFKGKRDPRRRNILCLSQPDVHDLLVEGVVKKFDEGYEMVMLGQADGYVECQCDKCQAIHPDIGEKLWITHRQIAGRIQKLRPGKKVVLLSYITTTKPPMSFDRFPDNVIIMNNRYTPEYFEAWKDFPTQRAIFIPDWLRNWPRIPPRYAVNLVRSWLENDVVIVYLGGGLDQLGSSWGLNGPSYYVFGKAMADPSLDADELEREYVEAAFGAAAEPMGRFFTAMHLRMEARQQLDRRETGNPDSRFRGFPFEMYPGDFHCHYFPPQILNKMVRELDLAFELAGSDEVRARLELTSAEFRYLRSVASVYHLFRAYQIAPTRPLLEALGDKVKQYHETYDWLYPDGKARTPGGDRKLRTPFNIGLTIGKKSLSKVPGPPFDWDFDELAKSGELPVPVIEPRLRGGMALKPYGRNQSGKGEVIPRPAGEEIRIDPETGAPFDQ